MGNHPKETSKAACLKSIIFCSPGLTALNGAEVHSSDFLLSRLRRGTQPQPGEFRSHVINPSIQLNEVPVCFGCPPFQDFLPWHSHPGSDKLGDSIQYEFSDGKIISIREILYHEYSGRVPFHLLPLMNQIRPEV